MTNDEYQQLIEFLGRKFEEIDRRFDRVEAKLAEHDDRFREISSHFDHLRTLFWSQFRKPQSQPQSDILEPPRRQILCGAQNRRHSKRNRTVRGRARRGAAARPSR